MKRYNPNKAAELLNVSANTIRAYLKNGMFPNARKKNGTRWEIPESDLDKFRRSETGAAGVYSENYIERKFVESCRRLGLRAVKMRDKGWPDRQVVGCDEAGDPLTNYVEFKDARGKLSPHQKKIIRWLREHGYTVDIIRSRRQVEEWFE